MLQQIWTSRYQSKDNCIAKRQRWHGRRYRISFVACGVKTFLILPKGSFLLNSLANCCYQLAYTLLFHQNWSEDAFLPLAAAFFAFFFLALAARSASDICCLEVEAEEGSCCSWSKSACKKIILTWVFTVRLLAQARKGKMQNIVVGWEGVLDWESIFVGTLYNSEWPGAPAG